MTTENANTMSPFLEEKRRELEKRLAELRPLVEEYERIKAMHEVLLGRPKRRG